MWRPQSSLKPSLTIIKPPQILNSFCLIIFFFSWEYCVLHWTLSSNSESRCTYLNFYNGSHCRCWIWYDKSSSKGKCQVPKGQEISKAIFESINFPKFDPKNLKDFCPMYFRAGILQISGVKLWKIDDFKNCFRDLLTFSW